MAKYNNEGQKEFDWDTFWCVFSSAIPQVIIWTTIIICLILNPSEKETTTGGMHQMDANIIAAFITAASAIASVIIASFLNRKGNKRAQETEDNITEKINKIVQKMDNQLGLSNEKTLLAYLKDNLGTSTNNSLTQQHSKLQDSSSQQYLDIKGSLTQQHKDLQDSFTKQYSNIENILEVQSSEVKELFDNMKMDAVRQETLQKTGYDIIAVVDTIKSMSNQLAEANEAKQKALVQERNLIDLQSQISSLQNELFAKNDEKNIIYKKIQEKDEEIEELRRINENLMNQVHELKQSVTEVTELTHKKHHVKNDDYER